MTGILSVDLSAPTPAPSSAVRFTVVSWNMLADCLTSKFRCEKHNFCPPFALVWSYRSELLLRGAEHQAAEARHEGVDEATVARDEVGIGAVAADSAIVPVDLVSHVVRSFHSRVVG